MEVAENVVQKEGEQNPRGSMASKKALWIKESEIKIKIKIEKPLHSLNTIPPSQNECFKRLLIVAMAEACQGTI